MPHPYAAGVLNLGQHPEFINSKALLRSLLPRRQRVADRLAKSVEAAAPAARNWGAKSGAHGARHASRGSVRWTPNAASSWIEATGTALKQRRRYISMNDPAIERVQFFAVDCDHEHWDELPGSLPSPLCTAISPGTERHHHLWAFQTPVLIGAESRMKPRRALAALEASLREICNGDPNFTNTLTKNPFASEEWNVIWWPRGRLVEFKDFEGWFVANDNHGKPWWKREVDATSSGFSRNVDVFDHTRFFAYRYGEPDFEAFLEKATEFNDRLAMPLAPAEVAGIARSVAKFMEQKWTGTKSSVVLSKEEIRARQAEAGRVSGAKNAERTKEKIRKAVALMKKKGRTISLNSVAAIAGVSRNTVVKNRQILAEGVVQNGPPLSGIPKAGGRGASRSGGGFSRQGRRPGHGRDEKGKRSIAQLALKTRGWIRQEKKEGIGQLRLAGFP